MFTLYRSDYNFCGDRQELLETLLHGFTSLIPQDPGPIA